MFSYTYSYSARYCSLEYTGCTRRVSLRRSPRRGAGRTLRFRWVTLGAHGRWDRRRGLQGEGVVESLLVMAVGTSIRQSRHSSPPTMSSIVPNVTDNQRGIQGADLATIMAKRTAKPEVRAAARAAAITKAKTEKRDKETKKSTAKAQGGSTAPKVSKQAMKGGAGGAGAGKGGR